MADLCIVCNLHLRQRQEVLCCISCHGKQHRTCNSGISREEYRRMRSQGQVVFQCVECVEPTVPYSEVTTTSELPSRLLPDAESTRIVEESINIPIVPHAEPHHPEEESLNDQTSPQELSTTEAVVTFQVTENTSQRGKRKLVSSDGFSYVVKKENKSGSILWRCSVRNSKTSCSATVHQQGDTFITNSKEHTHASKPGILTAVQMTQRIIETAKDDLFVPAPTIVERVIEEMADPREPEFARPKFSNAVRTANRRRQADRPEEPKDMNFEIDLEFLERHTSSDFYRGEVIVGDHRHLIFASDQQLQHLASAKTWYIDGTFKIVSKPFVQLLSIHFFARSGDDMKQLPGIYVLMPRKRKDYKTSTVPHQPTLGQLQRWIHQRQPTTEEVWTDLQRTVKKENVP